VNGSGGADIDTFPAQAAFVVVDVSNVVDYRNGFERTLFGTFATSDTSCRTSLAGYAAFVFIDTADEYPARFRSFLAKFDDVAGTGFHTRAARYAFFFVHFGQTGFGIDFDCVELASVHAIAFAQTSVTAIGFTDVQRMTDRTAMRSVIHAGAGAVRTRSVAPYYGYFRIGSRDFHS
jgi:hypothetical protein